MHRNGDPIQPKVNKLEKTAVSSDIERQIWRSHLFTSNAAAAAAAAKSLQSCPTLCGPIDSSPLGSSVPGILQARTLEWVAISFSNAWKWKVKVKSLSRVWLFTTPHTATYQAPPSMGFPGKSTGVECHCLLRLMWRFWLNKDDVIAVQLLSCVQLFMIPWSAAYQASPPMGFPGKSTGVGSASVRSLLFLSFIMPIFARNIVLISPIIFNRFLVFPHSIVFLYFF